MNKDTEWRLRAIQADLIQVQKEIDDGGDVEIGDILERATVAIKEGRIKILEKLGIREKE